MVGEDDGAVGAEGLLELGELEHVGVAGSVGDDRPGAAVLREREREALLPADEGICGQAWGLLFR